MKPRRTRGSDLLSPVMPPAPVLCTAEKAARRRLSLHRLALREPGFDPLELRLGLRVSYRQSRPGFAVSNPLYHEVLQRRPDLDDSLPGVTWLRAVYWRHFEMVCLPGVARHLRARAAARAAARAPASKAVEPQGDLFAAQG